MLKLPAVLGLAFASLLVSALGITVSSTFRNPLAKGADPCLTYYKGWYYLSVTTGRDVKIRKARHLSDLATAEAVTVYHSDDPDQSHAVWAPEFHRFGGKWYLYVTGGGGPEPSHRMWVAEGKGDTPLGPYVFKAKLLTDPKDEFYAIDGHPFRTKEGQIYFVWCGRPSATGQGLYISRMKDPWTLEGPRVPLLVDGFGCSFVREGPETLQRNGKVFLTYSACSADTPDYKIGMTVAESKADLLDPSSWKQDLTPIFQRNDEAGVYGTGHHFFFRSPDGKEDWIVYHAKPTTKIGYADRDTRAQTFDWKDGRPNLGKPFSIETELPAPSGEKPQIQ